ncbi:DUF559 domain-containing protein [Naasia lichenicola]|nr:DUF559 domain-containing protein [Naasia lichenicola]
MDSALASIMASLGGVAHIRDLLERGYSRHQVAAHDRRGDLLRPRIGWYVSPALSPDAIRAIGVGGRLGCISAARSYGLATPQDRRLHVALDDHATRLRSSRDGFRNISAGQDPEVVWHWVGDLGVTGDERFRVTPSACIVQASNCVSPEWTIGIIDSGLRNGVLDPRALEALHAHSTTRRLLPMADGRAESILESILRVRLRAAGLSPQPQVELGRYRVDLMLDGWLVIEADGATHGSERQFAWDRERDSFFARSGIRVLRFTYRQIVDEWPQTLATILAVRSRERPGH